MFVKHIIKNPTCFGHNCLTIFREPSFVLSAVTTSLLVCVVKLFIWYVAVCCLCVCVPDVLVCGMYIPQTSTSGTHTHRQHYSHIPNKRGKQADKEVTALSPLRRPPEDGQTIVTETCRVLIDVFYKHF